ncbi:MAG: hypothetical protein ABIR64_05070 [Candidatus Limnocylindrales bacterium]
MDRRGPRALLVLAVAVVSFAVLLAPRAQHGAPLAAAGATASPDSLAGPTAIRGSSPWDEVLAVISSAPAANNAGKGPQASGKPERTPKPTTAPTPNPTPSSTSNPTAAPTAKPTVAPTLYPTPAPIVNPAPCPLFPSTNVWNKRVDSFSVASNSAAMINGIGLGSALHPDFSSTAWNGGLGYGIPVNVVNLSTPRYSVDFYYGDESDAGPYPIPSSPKIEGGGDAHLLSWDTEGCMLYEIFDASKSGGQWFGGSGAIWDLRSNALRPDGWTSGDAAGLPILPGLVRYPEVSDGAILHALRFTAPKSCANHIYHARHDAGSYSCTGYPPMGLRVRLKASVNISSFGPQARVILLALQRYGMILADNGSPWYVTGSPHASWDDDDLHALGQIHGTDFEVVDTSNFR